MEMILFMTEEKKSYNKKMIGLIFNSAALVTNGNFDLHNHVKDKVKDDKQLNNFFIAVHDFGDNDTSKVMEVLKKCVEFYKKHENFYVCELQGNEKEKESKFEKVLNEANSISYENGDYALKILSALFDIFTEEV